MPHEQREHTNPRPQATWVRTATDATDDAAEEETAQQPTNMHCTSLLSGLSLFFSPPLSPLKKGKEKDCGRSAAALHSAQKVSRTTLYRDQLKGGP